jgi:folate-binding protein YgfZ
VDFRKTYYILPNLFTLSSVFCGFISISLSAYGQGGSDLYQAALERRAVSWKKGCYLGQEVVFMQDARGKVKRRLVRLRGPAGAAISRGARVCDASGADVGEVTTGATGGALARLQAPHFEPGASLVVGETPVVVEALDAGLFGRTGPAGRVPE